MIKLDRLVDTGKETLAVLRSCFGQILILHIAYVVLGIIVFGPLTGLIVRLLLQVSGNRVMADMDILFFILSPFGMAALVLFGSVLVTMFAFEQASIRKIDIGSWFSAQYSNERVPTLKEILEEVRGKERVFIELKYYSHDQQLEGKR